MKAKCLLLVEDNPDDEALTPRALRGIANDVVVARAAAAALDYFFGGGDFADRNLEDLASVVILDLKLPKVDGLEVLRRIRADERTRLLPVVVLTSSDEQRDLAESYSRGANSYVRKPLTDFGRTCCQRGAQAAACLDAEHRRTTAGNFRRSGRGPRRSDPDSPNRHESVHQRLSGGGGGRRGLGGEPASDRRRRGIGPPSPESTPRAVRCAGSPRHRPRDRPRGR